MQFDRSSAYGYCVEDRGRRRRELEQIAFGADASDQQRRAAHEALLSLDESPDAEAEPSARERRGRRGRTAILISAVVVALAVGAVGGYAIPRAGGETSAAGSADGSTGRASRQAPVARADALLAQPRDASDVLPRTAAGQSGFIASTTHLVATSAAGEKIFVASQSGVNVGYCFVTSLEGLSGGFSGSVRCAPIAQFAKTGVSISSDGFTARWTGDSVVVTVADDA